MTLTMSRTSRPPGCSEQELVAAIRAGDDCAFEELYARYRDRISAFILSKVHDHGRAEDIAQEVFMSALRRLRSTDQAIAFKPWIYEIAKNACIDEFRRGTRSREVPLESDGEFVVDRQAAALSSVPTPSAAVESKQRLDDLRGAFGGLSANHHQLLVMREFEGLSYDEIGLRLDMSRQMVESSLFRARRKLSDEYQELASGQRCEQIQTAIDGGRLRSATSLGLRDRRRFARHLSHCQPCRHAALMAGVDEVLVKPRTSVAAKIAALLPFPVWRFWSRSPRAKASASGSHQMAGAGSAGVGSAGSALTLGQAAATVAVVIAGAGGGLAVNSLASSGHHRAPATAESAGHRASAAGSATSAAAAKAAHARGAAASHRSGAISLGSSPATTARPTAKRRHRAPTSGGSGSGGGGGSTASTGSGNGGTTGTAVSGVRNAANNLAGSASGAGKALTGVTSGVGKTVNGVTSGVGKTVNGVTSGVGKTVNGVTSGVGNAVNTVTQATGTATTPVGQAVGNTTTTVGQAVGGATNGVTQAAGGSTSAAGTMVNGVTGSAAKTAVGVTGGLSNAVSGATGATSQSAGTAPSGSSAQTAGSGLQQAGSILGH